MDQEVLQEPLSSRRLSIHVLLLPQRACRGPLRAMLPPVFQARAPPHAMAQDLDFLDYLLSLPDDLKLSREELLKIIERTIDLKLECDKHGRILHSRNTGEYQRWSRTVTAVSEQAEA